MRSRITGKGNVRFRSFRGGHGEILTRKATAGFGAVGNWSWRTRSGAASAQRRTQNASRRDRQQPGPPRLPPPLLSSPTDVFSDVSVQHRGPTGPHPRLHPGTRVQLSGKAVWLEMPRVSLHSVSVFTSIIAHIRWVFKGIIATPRS